MRFSIDTGGTFTDLVIEDDSGQLHLFKSPTTPDDPIRGILDVLDIAAQAMNLSLPSLLGRSDHFIHATTRAINAILTNNTAKTAFLTTRGHPDVLLLREGGRERFNLIQNYPEPYVPRSLTFEVPERIGSSGQIVTPLDEMAVLEIIARLSAKKIEAIAVCFLWSIVNPAHEVRVGELLTQRLPGVPYTLSHKLNPIMREYRRASSTAIDASLKPLMTGYLRGLKVRLDAAGFKGRLLIVTSSGGVLDADDVAQAPIHAINSGPSMAPVAGRYYASVDAGADTVVVADTGGTSYDVSLVRRGTIPRTRETWLGPEFTGHMTGFPSIDVKSIGAGGGSIAWIDEGGLLHVGPQSAAAVPGPACYGRGGTKPTVTDASLVLGHIDPAYFLGGAMRLDVAAARHALDEHVGQWLKLSTHEAAAAVMQVLTENMVQLIEEISVKQGVDPRTAVLIGGGGAAGLNSVAIARRLGCSQIIIPETGAVLSAVGALLSDLTTDFAATFVTTNLRFDFDKANVILANLEEECRAFISESKASAFESRIELFAEVRYPSEIWELEVPIRNHRLNSPEEVEQLRQDFHRVHAEVFGVSDPTSSIVIVSWRARASCRYRSGDVALSPRVRLTQQSSTTRSIYFPSLGFTQAAVHYFEALKPGQRIEGPTIVESPVTTVVIDPGATAVRTPAGSLLIDPGRANAAASTSVRILTYGEQVKS